MMQYVTRCLDELAVSAQDGSSAEAGHLGSPGNTASQQQPSCSELADSSAQLNNSLIGLGKPAFTPLMDGGRWFVFIRKPVCAVCGAMGHLASTCTTPLCGLCGKYGHLPGCCEAACSKCGKQQTSCKGKKCRTAACSHCGLYGHDAPRCPRAECIKCGYFGHMMSACPVPDTAVSASSPRHSARSHSRASSVLNDGGQSLTDSLLADNPRHAKAASKPVKQTSSDVDKLQLAARLLGDAAVHPPKLELLPSATSPEEAQERQAQLVHSLFSQYPEYAIAVANDSSKLACLSRIARSDLDVILANPHAMTLLDNFYQQQQHKQQQEQERQRQEEQQKQRQRQLERERQRQHRRNQQEQAKQQRRQHPSRPQQTQQQQQPRQHAPPQEQAQMQQQAHYPSRQELEQQQRRKYPAQLEQLQQQQRQYVPPPPPPPPPHSPGVVASDPRAHQFMPEIAIPQQQRRHASVQRRHASVQRKRLPSFNVLDDVLPKGGRVGNVLVCLLCGAIGHQVSKCRTPYCTECLKYGHASGDCKSGCSRCGWRHGTPCDDQCAVPQCGRCKLWGHRDPDCPVPRCSLCGTYGHEDDCCPKHLGIRKHQVAPVLKPVEVPR